VLAHAMFSLPLVAAGTAVRSGAGQWLAEGVATAGLLLTIFGIRSSGHRVVAGAVGLYIAAAYWFTASTSFANPAVTLARALTPTFAGIRPADVAPFIAAQLAAALVASLAARRLFAPSAESVPNELLSLGKD
jgi:glycerol uptake facilitator-like aquaporin